MKRFCLLRAYRGLKRYPQPQPQPQT